MNRAEMISFINEKVLPGAEIEDADWLQNGREIFKAILKGIIAWRHGKNINIEMEARILDGVLFINGDSVTRVAPKLPRVPWSDEAHYWEGRCLGRAGL